MAIKLLAMAPSYALGPPLLNGPYAIYVDHGKLST
jgi:hypothetical protein